MLKLTIFSVAALLLFYSCNAQIPGFGGCPDVKVKENFQIKQYMGVWYEYQRYFVVFEILSKCGKATYTFNTSDSSVIVENSGINKWTGAANYIKGRAVAPDKRVPAKLEVTFPRGGPFAKGKYWVLDTDYRSYAIVYSCSDIKLVHADIVWVLSRNRMSLPDSTMKKIYETLKGQGIKTKYLKNIDQKNCSN